MLGQTQESINCKFVNTYESTSCNYTDFTVFTDPELSIDPNYLASFEPIVINIFFWDVLNDEGQSINNAPPIGDFEKEALDVVAAANIFYNPYNIFFKYLGHGEIHETYLVETVDPDDDDVSIPQLSHKLGKHIYIEPDPDLPSDLDLLRNANAYNLYISGNGASGGGAGYRTGYPLHAQTRGTFIDNSGIHKHTLHEIGHSLGLDHPWSDFGTPEDVAEGITVLSGCERFTRDHENPYFNVPNHGDRVLDTAATPNFQTERWYELFWSQLEVIYLEGDATADDYYAARDYANTTYIPRDSVNLNDEYIHARNCNYTGTNKDCYRQDSYQLYYQDTNNLMAYTIDCTDLVLTTGQAIRMRETIALDCDNVMTPALNTDGVESLYEPYKGEYYVNGSIPVDINGAPNPPLLQPGFDYNFIDCDCFAEVDCDLPLEYGNSSFNYNEQIGTFISKNDTHYGNITHSNHTAIKIIQLDNSQPWRCYDNYNRKPSGGTIIKFNDNVLNTNVTITPQDSTAINNQNLINNLDPGLYNIIEQYDDGNTEEKVILKENN